MKCLVMEVAKVIQMGIVWVAPLKAIQITECQKCAWLFVGSLIATFSIMTHYSRVESQSSAHKEVSEHEIERLEYGEQWKSKNKKAPPYYAT